MKPTIYVTNFASLRTPGFRGNGLVYTIMRYPGKYHRGDGRVELLAPLPGHLLDFQRGLISAGEYRVRYLATLQEDLIGWRLNPGHLKAKVGDTEVPVADGDTLCCSCSRAKAAAGECHRVFAGKLMQKAGWRVILDGRELA